MNENLLSRDNSNVLRGLGIMAIMFHNFLHINGIGFAPENEMSFNIEKSQFFFSKFLSGEANYIADTISFLGWTGVSVFVFLTGYGLMTKYPTISSIWQFIKRNYLKLLLLLLPGLLIFFGVDIMTGEYSHIPKRLCYLTMLQNLAYPYLSVGPGVYWYFSLTFQLYLLYAFAHKWMNAKNLIIWSVITLAILWLLGTLQWEDSFSIFRHCFTGWFPPFAIGIYYAQKRHVIDAKQSPLYLDIILAIALLAAMILMNAIFSIWLFIPILGLYWYIVLSKLVMRCGGYVMKFFVWIGKYSACIFVCHPIVRGVLVRLYGRFGHLGLITLAFFILTLLVAFYYDKLYKFAMKRFVK